MAILEFTKLTVKYIINLLIQKHRQDICQQHEVSHPSQICHSCIFTLEKYYFFRYYDVLCKRFWNGHFTSTLLQILRLEGFTPPPAQVKGVAKAYLFELQDSCDIKSTLEEIEASVTEVTRTNMHIVLEEKYNLWLGE